MASDLLCCPTNLDEGRHAATGRLIGGLDHPATAGPFLSQFIQYVPTNIADLADLAAHAGVDVTRYSVTSTATGTERPRLPSGDGCDGWHLRRNGVSATALRPPAPLRLLHPGSCADGGAPHADDDAHRGRQTCWQAGDQMFTLNYVRYGEPRYGADLVIALLALKQLEVLDVRVDALIGDGLLSEEPVCAEHGMFVYDALYAWCARQVETTPAT